MIYIQKMQCIIKHVVIISVRIKESHRTLFDNIMQSKPKSKRGRPSDVNRESAFLFVANYLKEIDDEQTTINDLLSIMQEHLKDSSSDAFT